MPFSQTIKEEALLRSKRHCCLCHKFGSRNVNVHHMLQEAAGGPNTLDNAIVLCLDCHADVGHYNPQHPLGVKYQIDELKKHRDNWWGLCSSGAYIYKDVSTDYLLKQHEVVFERWTVDARDLSRSLRSIGRLNSTYGMRQFVDLAVKYVAGFLFAIEKDFEVEANSGATADLTTFFVELFHSDEQFLVEKLSIVFPDRISERILDEGKAELKNKYNQFTLKVFGSCVE